MNWYEWLFDGLGTAVISAICGLISYKAAVKKASKQTQRAGDESKQEQKLTVTNREGEKGVQSTIRQKQKAGDNSEQVQCGEIKNGK